MYCGSCMRDNALVAELQDMGWDISLLPLYTPIRTDDEDRSIDRVFFGGVNVYLQQKVPIFRHLPGLLDRWIDSPKFLKRVASGNISTDAAELGEMTLSMAKGEDGYQKREVKKLIHWLKETEKPDLICLTNLLVGGSIPALKRELDIPILVTLQGDDVFLDELTEPWHTKILDQMKALAQLADGFITFSSYYRDRMCDLLEIAPERFHLTPLGINVSEYDGVWQARQQRETHGKTIGYFARICPEKGFDLIISAFLKLADQDPDYQLITGGWLSAKDEAFFSDQIARLEAAGLSDRFTHLGSTDHSGKLDFFQTIDVFCVPARFVEPKGLYLLEAMACGIPVVAPDRGAFPEIINSSSGGSLFTHGDTDHLATQLAATDSTAGPRGRDWVEQHGNRRAMAEATAIAFEKLK